MSEEAYIDINTEDGYINAKTDSIDTDIDKAMEGVLEDAFMKPSPSPCPNCGYCPHCGRGPVPYEYKPTIHREFVPWEYGYSIIYTNQAITPYLGYAS